MNELQHQELPYDSIKALKSDYAAKRIYLATNKKCLDKWVDGEWKNIEPPFSVTLYFLVRQHISVLTNLIVAIYSISHQLPLLLLSIPLTILLKLVFRLNRTKSIPSIHLVIGSILVGGMLLVSLWQARELAVVMLVLLLNWLGQRGLEEGKAKLFFKKILEDEKFCRWAWDNGAFTIRDCEREEQEDSLDTVSTTEEFSGFINSDLKLSIARETTEPTNMKAQSLVENKAMELVIRHERNSNRTPTDVSALYVGYDIVSVGKDGKKRYIEVKGKAKAGSVLITPNEWKTAKQERSDYYLYIVEGVLSQETTLRIIRNPYEKAYVRLKKEQYLFRRKDYIQESVKVKLIDIFQQ